jgi:hypothetical protein
MSYILTFEDLYCDQFLNSSYSELPVNRVPSLPRVQRSESVPQQPHEGDYSNADQFETLSREQHFSKPIALVADDPLAKEFRERMAEWKRDTRGLSSVSEIVMHPSYQWIMAKGELALPFILRDLRQNGGQWFHALYYIHGRDEAAGTKTIEAATAAWIEWGYKNNHI